MAPLLHRAAIINTDRNNLYAISSAITGIELPNSRFDMWNLVYIFCWSFQRSDWVTAVDGLMWQVQEQWLQTYIQPRT